MFAHFIYLFPPTKMSDFRKYSLYHATAEEWTSIVKLAHQWDFSGVKSLAVRELERLEIPPLRKIVIYHSYVIDRRLLRSAYAAFASRDEPITIEEGQELGLETSLHLAHARELARVPATAGKRSKDARSPAKVTGVELDELIRELFQLPPPERDPTSHVVLGKPTGNSNITSGQAEAQSDTQPNKANSNDPNSAKGKQDEHHTPILLP